ncbi:OadG family protein [Alteromonas flava]|uniref:OadG family protein n=1 Tax=Alteromonas flava TaxID=2048003 RepID=UPI000C2906F7|nr:OadG family transporter subunit [Alteromonas flava]
MPPVNSLTSQLSEAALLMGVGMVSVFAFLTLLIVAMSVLKRFVERFPPPEVPAPAKPNKSIQAGHPDQQVVAAITAAVHQYRQSK